MKVTADRPSRLLLERPMCLLVKYQAGVPADCVHAYSYCMYGSGCSGGAKFAPPELSRTYSSYDTGPALASYYLIV